MRAFLAILCVGVLFGPVLATAQTPKPSNPAAKPNVQIISPATPQSWSYGDMENHRLIWNPDKKELRAELTFSQGVYSDVNTVADQEIYEIPFPGVRYDAVNRQFVAKSPKGVDVPVAKNQKMLFGSQIELLPTSRVTIYNFSGKLVVVLSGTTDQAYATGTNKWIVRPKGWYLQNIYQ